MWREGLGMGLEGDQAGAAARAKVGTAFGPSFAQRGRASGTARILAGKDGGNSYLSENSTGSFWVHR